ncbi:MAG: FecR domain-containing protein [Chloroflexi bacterium]|nr:FecR domain-containing protein [Chloroflexota bacterium]
MVTANNYRRYATDSPPAVLSVGQGKVFYQGPANAIQLRASSGMQLEEGSFVEVGDNGRSMLELFDSSTVTLTPSSRLELTTHRLGRFNADHTRLSLSLSSGAANLNVAGKLPFGREITVATPHGVVSLSKGDYLVWVQEDGTRVSSYSGRVKADIDENVVRLRDGQRAILASDGLPRGPFPLMENLVRNGDFSRQLQGWTMLDKGEPGRPDIGGTRRLMEEAIAGRKVQALKIIRDSPRDAFNETGIVQEINRDVSAYRNVSFTAWIKIDHASLSGGGYLGSEYPMMFRVNYTDEKGARPGWTQGFYYANPENRPTDNGELIAQGQWYPYLGRLSDLRERPTFIRSIEALSAGHDFDALVADIRLIAE